MYLVENGLPSALHSWCGQELVLLGRQSDRQPWPHLLAWRTSSFLPFLPSNENTSTVTHCSSNPAWADALLILFPVESNSFCPSATAHLWASPFLVKELPNAKRYSLSIHLNHCLLETVWDKAVRQEACVCLEPLYMDLVAGSFLELLFELQAFSIQNI